VASESDPQILKLTRKQVQELLADESVSAFFDGGIPVRIELLNEIESSPARVIDRFSLQEKVSLFTLLFVGRIDVYATRWESKAGKSGYSPVCENQWRPGICQLPRIKCADCSHRQYASFTEQVLESHLRGDKTVGLYPLLPDSKCWFLAFDCDGKNWSDDSLALLRTIQDWNLCAYRERSRSGDGAHIWMFFAQPIAARQARMLGTAILTKTMENRPELGLASYDRMFPNQDWIPEGGFGNLIALPLQKIPRGQGNSVFIDDQGNPIEDQWTFLSEIKRISSEEINARVRDKATNGNDLGLEKVSTDEDLEDRWSSVAPAQPSLLSQSRPATTASNIGPISVRLDGEVSIRVLDDKGESLPPAKKNQLIRLAAFQNPEFYQAQRLRLNTFQIPRVIGCAVEDDGWLKLPRGLSAEVIECLSAGGFTIEAHDNRNNGKDIDVSFVGSLHAEQQKVIEIVLSHETGIISAPTGFGKTVLACSILARRKVSTLILVHRGQLLDQWRAQLQALLGCSKKEIGVFGKGSKRPTGRIDVATIQSLYQGKKVDPMIMEYGQIIVDECHHVSAFSFEQVLRAAPARYVLGLTATPIRRDGLHPIMFMQCGPLRVKVKQDKSSIPHKQEVAWKDFSPTGITTDMNVTDLYALLAQDETRTALIVDNIFACLSEGRFPLVLTERKAHLDSIHQALAAKTESSIAVLYGGQGKKARASAMAMIETDAHGPRVVLATGKLVGEGFDLPELDTLFIALPISWRGTLQQYVGRLARFSANKSIVRVYDYQDLGHPILLKMGEKRRAGYKMLGFTPAE